MAVSSKTRTAGDFCAPHMEEGALLRRLGLPNVCGLTNRAKVPGDSLARRKKSGRLVGVACPEGLPSKRPGRSGVFLLANWRAFGTAGDRRRRRRPRAHVKGAA